MVRPPKIRHSKTNVKGNSQNNSKHCKTLQKYTAKIQTETLYVARCDILATPYQHRTAAVQLLSSYAAYDATLETLRIKTEIIRF